MLKEHLRLYQLQVFIWKRIIDPMNLSFVFGKKIQLHYYFTSFEV